MKNLFFFVAKEGDDLKDTAIEATTRLKQALMNEREAKLRLQGDVEKLREHIHELNRQLKVAKEAEESLKGSLRALEEVTAKMERDKLQQQTHEVRVIGWSFSDLYGYWWPINCLCFCRFQFKFLNSDSMI